MSGGHAGPVMSRHVPKATPVHATDPAVKLAALLGFLFAVVATPPAAVWAFGLHGLLVGAAALLARLPPRVLARRLTVEVPFVLFALALPLVGDDPRRAVPGLGIPLSVPGSWAAWAIVAKATLGTAATVVLAWSTPVAGILVGLERLRVPRALTAIAGFMVRYLDVIAGELRRLQIARVSRGDDPRWMGQGRAVAATAGTVVVRSFERGERVHQAMLSRGFTGRFPPATAARLPSHRAGALAFPAAAWLVAGVALVGS